VNVPDLSTYDLHRVVEDSPVRGVAVPGLRATYYRAGRHTAGVYTYRGVEIFVAWGYVDEVHCRSHAFRAPDGTWEPARRGCPRVRTTPEGLLLRTRSGDRQVTGALAGSTAS
jgi:hypothetical protein